MSTNAGTAAQPRFKPALWTPGDWNAFFRFGSNILVNMLVLTGLLKFVLKMPDTLVFGRIMHGAVGIGGGLGMTPGVALAYAVVAVGFFAVEKFSASTATFCSRRCLLQPLPHKPLRPDTPEAPPIRIRAAS
jgi:hypothetical protein